MGVEYTDGDEIKVFHPLPEELKNGENIVYGNPRELSLAELAMLPHLTYKINRFGAVSRMPLIQCYPQDIARLELIARMYENLMIGAAVRMPTQRRCLTVTRNTWISRTAAESLS